MPDKNENAQQEKKLKPLAMNYAYDLKAHVCKKITDLFFIIFLIFMVVFFVKERYFPWIFDLLNKVNVFSEQVSLLKQEKEKLSSLLQDINALRSALESVKSEIIEIRSNIKKLETQKNAETQVVDKKVFSALKKKRFQIFLCSLMERIPFNKAFEHIVDFPLSPSCSEKLEELKSIYVDNLKVKVLMDDFNALYLSADKVLKEDEHSKNSMFDKIKKYFMDNVYISFSSINVFSSQRNVLERMKKNIEAKNIKEAIIYAEHLNAFLGFEGWLKKAHVFIDVEKKLKELSEVKEVFA